MNIYVVFDKATGRIVHTTSFYVLGTDDPIDCPEEEILKLAREEVGDNLELGVTRIPEGFDVRDRSKRLEVDVATGTCRACARKATRSPSKPLARGKDEPESEAATKRTRRR